MKTKLSILLTLVGILFINGCTNLNEVILDETSATGLSDKQAADGIIAGVCPFARYFSAYQLL